MIQLELDLTWLKKVNDLGLQSFSSRTVAEIAILHGISRIAVPLEWTDFSSTNAAFQVNQIFSNGDATDLVNQADTSNNLTICEKLNENYSPITLSRTDDIKFIIEALVPRKVQFFIAPKKDQVRNAYDLGASGILLDASDFLNSKDHHNRLVSLECLSNMAMQAYRYDLCVTLGGDFDIPDCQYLRNLDQFDYVTIGRSFFNRSLLLGVEHTVREFLKAL